MIDKIISSIIEAETKAADEIKSANALAKEIMLKARSDSDYIEESSAIKLKEEIKKIITEAENKADMLSLELIEEGKAKAIEMSKSIGKKKEEAIKTVVKRIKSKYGNS